MNPTTVVCPHCHAGVSQPCVIPGTGTKLTLSAAHPSRCEEAGMQPTYGAVARYREVWRDVEERRGSREQVSDLSDTRQGAG